MITASTKRTWELIDGAEALRPEPKYVSIAPGTYPLERVPNPHGYSANWLVLIDSSIGMAEGAWRQWKNGELNSRGEPIDWGDFEIIVQE